MRGGSRQGVAYLALYGARLHCVLLSFDRFEKVRANETAFVTYCIVSWCSGMWPEVPSLQVFVDIGLGSSWGEGPPSTVMWGANGEHIPVGWCV